MLLACRLAGLSAPGAHYAGIKARATSPCGNGGPPAVCRTSRRTGWDSWAWAAACAGTALNFPDLGVTTGDDNQGDSGYRRDGRASPPPRSSRLIADLLDAAAAPHDCGAFLCSLRSLLWAACRCAAQLDRLAQFGGEKQMIGRQ